MYMVVWAHISVNVYTDGRALVARIVSGIRGRSLGDASSPTSDPRAEGLVSNDEYVFTLCYGIGT
jgi:hypothetical protein